MLEHLVRHAGELVTKNDLLAAVWGDRVVTDDSITQCISEIRSALGAPGQALLQTVPRRGYRLEPPVAEPAPEPASNETGSGHSSSSRIAIGSFAVLLVAIVLFIGLRDDAPDGKDVEVASPGPTSVKTPDDPRPSLAVLPFVYRGADEAHSILADGFHDDLLTSLARSRDLRVISRTSVMPYRDSLKSMREIGGELGVDHVLEGSLEAHDAEIRVTVQLIEAETDAHLWAQAYDRELDPNSLFALRNELSRAIASALEAELDVRTRGPTENVVALEAYHLGRRSLFRGGVAQLQDADAHFRRAVEIDPAFADAWVGLADSQMLLMRSGTVTWEESSRMREAAIERALAIDPDHAGAHAARGWLGHDWAGNGSPEHAAAAEAAFLKAIELNPNDARSHMGYALLLNLAYPERISESAELLRTAQRLDPRSTVIAVNLAATERFRGLFDPAERALLDALVWDPEMAGTRRVLTRLYLDWGRLADARLQAEEAVLVDADNVANWDLLGETALELRDEVRAREVLEALRALAPDHPATLTLEVKLLARAVRYDAVRARLDEALDSWGPDPGLVSFAVMTLLTMGDEASAARWENLLSLSDDEDAWPGFIRVQGDFACVLGWLVARSGRAERGARLVAASREYLVETLPASRDHVDRYKPDLCHLASGELEPALASIEQQAAHGHIALWDDWHRLPLYDAIRDDERYRAAVARREQLLDKERRQAGLVQAELP